MSGLGEEIFGIFTAYAALCASTVNLLLTHTTMVYKLI
jgi:hypothetical protein